MKLLEPRSIQLTALGLTGLAAAAGAYWSGSAFALGVLLGGVLAAANFRLLERSVDQQVDLAVNGGKAGVISTVFRVIRLAALLAILWFLLGHFDGIALLLGLCSVVAAMVLHAALALGGSDAPP